MTADPITLAGRLAVRARLLAPVASFRDPMFPGLQAGLLVPPPATIRGLLAAAWGSYERLGRVHVGIAFRIGGEVVDVETYHPLNTDGRVRFPGAEQGPKPLERHLVVDAGLTVWALHADPTRCAAALRRPVWALHLGRSQDLRTCASRWCERATIAGWPTAAFWWCRACNLGGGQRRRRRRGREVLPVAIGANTNASGMCWWARTRMVQTTSSYGLQLAMQSFTRRTG